MSKFKIGDVVVLKSSKNFLFRYSGLIPNIQYKVVYIGLVKYHLKDDKNKICYAKEEELEIYCPRHLKAFT